MGEVLPTVQTDERNNFMFFFWDDTVFFINVRGLDVVYKDWQTFYELWKLSLWARDAALLLEGLSSMHRALGSILKCCVDWVWQPSLSTQETGARTSGNQGHPALNRKFEAVWNIWDSEIKRLNLLDHDRFPTVFCCISQSFYLISLSQLVLAYHLCKLSIKDAFFSSMDCSLVLPIPFKSGHWKISYWGYYLYLTLVRLNHWAHKMSNCHTQV